MTRAYTPGLVVSKGMLHRVRRLLPLAGEVLVKNGEAVKARQPVAQALMPGDVTPLNMSKLLSLPPSDVPECMLKGEGDAVQVGEVLARTKGIFGMLRSEYKSPVAGTIEAVSNVTGQVIIRGAASPLEVLAYMTGKVQQILPGEGCVVEASVAFIQGIFGIGGEAFGPIRMAGPDPQGELVPELLQTDMRGCVVIGGARVTHEALVRAKSIGVSAIVAGGIDDEDLERFLGYSVGVAITGSEQAGLTLVLTEGFGMIGMARRTFDLLASHEGHEASVNGATQIRAGVLRPEVVIPLDSSMEGASLDASTTVGVLEIGAPVRAIRDPHFGKLGTVTALPSELQILESGSKSRVLEVQFDSGGSAIIPRANVELIEG